MAHASRSLIGTWYKYIIKQIIEDMKIVDFGRDFSLKVGSLKKNFPVKISNLSFKLKGRYMEIYD